MKIVIYIWILLQDASFYPFLRLFVPYKDSERGTFGIQIPTLGRLFVKALAINPNSDHANKLTNLQGNSTDYGDIVYDVMRNRSPAEGTLTVYEVNKYLDLIGEHFKDNERSSEYSHVCFAHNLCRITINLFAYLKR